MKWCYSSYGRHMSLVYKFFGRIPNKFLIPYHKEEITRLQRVQDGWTFFIATTGAIFDNHYPDSHLISFLKNHPVIFPRIIKTSHLKGACSVFTGGSSKGYAVVVSDSIKEKRLLGPISVRAAELMACLMAFSLFKDQPFNLYTDSTYVARIVGSLETSPYILPTSQIFHLWFSYKVL